MSKTNNRIPCPINEGADLNSQFLMEALFDDMDYVERETKLHRHVAMGFIDGIPVIVTWHFGKSNILIHTARPTTMDDVVSFRKTLPERLTDEQVEPEIFANEMAGEWNVTFYYKDND